MNDVRLCVHVFVNNYIQNPRRKKNWWFKPRKSRTRPQKEKSLLLIEEQNGILALASSLIFIGSVLGIITGLLLLQGNPSELLDQSAGEDVIDVYGIVLEAETGEAIEGVYVDLINAQTKESIQKVETNSYGYYEFQNVVSKEHVLRVTLENYSTIERTFAPDSATQAPFTLSKGNELLEEDLTLSNLWMVASKRRRPFNRNCTRDHSCGYHRLECSCQCKASHQLSSYTISRRICIV